ncbi:GAF domain-containing sensor histidine kinase [bacterium]|nr:GAF domain-containing sensor histidine kinase [bacterium]
MEHEDPGWTGPLAWQLILSLGLVGWLLSGLKAPADPVPVMGLSGLGIGLEIAAVAWPSLGFSSAAPACYLALALLPEQASSWAGLACLLGLGLRSLLRPSPTPALTARAVAASALPVLAALAAGRWIPTAWRALGLVDIYLPLAFLAPAALAAEFSGPAENRWRRVRARTVLSWISIGFLAVPLAQLRSLWLVPVLFGLQRSAVAAVEAVREEEGKMLRGQLEESRRSEQKARQEVNQVRRELGIKVEERALFEELARQYAQAQDLASTRTATLQMALRLAPYCCSAALFEPEQEAWTPVEAQSPQRKRVEAARLLHLNEPCVQEAASTRQVAIHAHSGERIFENERAAVALPISENTILYVGSLRQEITPETLGLLRLLGQQAGEALQAARRYDQLQEKAEDGSKLRQNLDQVSELLAACVRLTESPQLEEILDLLADQLKHVVAHDSFALAWEDSRRGSPLAPELAAILQESGRSLLVDDLSRGKVPPLRPGEASLLAVPLRAEGVIVLGHRQPRAFSRQHLESIQVLALQARLSLQNARLFQQIQKALADLRDSQARVVQSSKMAAVGQLAAGVAHEVNTPLAAMMLTIQSCQLTPNLPGHLVALLERAEKAGQRARDIIEKLLYYSRDARVGRRRGQLEAVVRDSLDLIGQQLRIDRLEVRLESAPMADVLANQNELQQVFTNLILNARDALLAAPEAPRLILVRIYPAPQGAVAEVRDAGPGIPEEIRSKIFDPFFTTKPVGQGTGLGLAVTQQLVESHGGSLSYEPQQPGSLFRVILPWGKGEDDVDSHPAA